MPVYECEFDRGTFIFLRQSSIVLERKNVLDGLGPAWPRLDAVLRPLAELAQPRIGMLSRVAPGQRSIRSRIAAISRILHRASRKSRSITSVASRALVHETLSSTPVRSLAIMAKLAMTCKPWREKGIAVPLSHGCGRVQGCDRFARA